MHKAKILHFNMQTLICILAGTFQLEGLKNAFGAFFHASTL